MNGLGPPFFSGRKQLFPDRIRNAGRPVVKHENEETGTHTMDLNLKDKTVLVTGGATGLGRAISAVFAQEGADLAVNYRSRAEEAQALAAELTERYGVRVLPVYADVAEEDEVRAMFDEVEAKLGPVRASVNNAAYCANPECADLELPEFQKCVSVNLQGMFLVCRETVRRLRRQRKPGHIVNISSQAAVRGSASGKTAYDMTKAGVLGFTRSLAIETAKDNILVNAVLPGLMYTDIIARQIDADPERYNKRSPLGRIARTEEIAQVTVFLCSDRASYMTGATVDVSGGMALH
ncbi:MAG: SDR family oxidoreductase [Planctomycetaceae bacterium]|jgi:3-oxoacyl-[acyl-carrier protein] reductase|nr:SDR family oxidoreductase [Planctomycetaceae bacterium]